MSEKDRFLTKALKMTPTEKAEIIDQLIKSLDKPDEEIDKLWREEVEERINSYENDDIETVTMQEVMEKYKNKKI